MAIQNTSADCLRKISQQVKSEIRLCLETLRNRLNCLQDKCVLILSRNLLRLNETIKRRILINQCETEQKVQ